MFRRKLAGVFGRVGLVPTALVAGLMLFAATAHAMRVSPMVSEITTRGAGSAARIEVGNVGSAALPFETVVTKIDYDADGNLIETPSDEKFLVFPPQGLVPVGGRQVVRVQWVGDPDLEVSEAYYVAVRQLPVSAEPKDFATGGGLSMSVLYTMKALVVVAPPGAEPKVEVTSARVIELPAAPAPEVDPALAGEPAPAAAPSAPRPGLEVMVTNTGKRYALMSGATWLIRGTGQDGQPLEVRLTSNEISEAVGVGYLAPAGGKRTFRVPTGQAFASDKPVTVRFVQ